MGLIKQTTKNNIFLKLLILLLYQFFYLRMYAKSLVEVGKLVYLIGNYPETAQIKKVLETNETKGKTLFKSFEEMPPNALRKIKPKNVRQGTIRSDWMQKIIDRYPQMVIFLYNCGDDTYDLEKVEVILRQILKKTNLFCLDCLKPNNKEDIVVRIIVTTTKQQFSNQQIQTKISYYLKTYQKDVFVIQNQFLSRDITKYRATWLSYLEKNYDRKNKKLIKKLQQSNNIQKRICYSFKLALFSQILAKDQKSQYANSYNIIKYKFAQITKKQFNFLKYLDIRQIRIIADTIVLRYIKFKIGNNVKEIPEFVNSHLNFFKMRSMDPSACHFYYYYQELLWRSTLIDNVLQVFYASEIMELLPHVLLAELINGLLSYLHKLATIDPKILSEVFGKVLELGTEQYIGKLNYSDITDSDLVTTGISNIISRKKDFVSKGIQIITRYKTSGLFKQNQINFLNIYLIRFYIAEGKFASIVSIYHEILKLELNRCNYFLINELFNEIKSEMDKIDNSSKVILYGVSTLICDFFQNKYQLNNLIVSFFDILKEENKQGLTKDTKGSLFDKQFAPQAHIFKLKKSSLIAAVKVFINDQIILSEARLVVKVKLTLNGQVRKRLNSEQNRLKLHFNHNMIIANSFIIGQNQPQVIERQFIIEPLQFVRKDAVLKIQSVQIEMENKNLVWVVERNQIVFEKFDSTLLFCKIEEPQIIIQSINKIYYINEAANFSITVKGIEGCKVTSKLLVFQSNEGSTQFFMNMRDKKNLTNSKLPQELVVSSDTLLDDKNVCWLKFNKLGAKNLRLQFTNVVQKTIKVGWRQKPLSLKSTYSTVKEVNFNVTNLFIINRIFRQAATGNLFDSNIPINKKTLLSFYIKANENVIIKELSLHNNPRKIKYYKNIKMANLNLIPGQNLKANLLFELGDDCAGQFELFLTTLIIKWTRANTSNPIENCYLDEQIKINASNDKILIGFQQAQEIKKRKKGYLFIKLQNLTNEPLTIKALMENTQNLSRIGERCKIRVLQPKEKVSLSFEIFAVHSGIFEFPPTKIFVNDVDSKINTNNLLVYCN